MTRRVLLVALLLVAAFVAGRVTARPTVPPSPVAEPVEILAPIAPTDRACKSELASSKAQLAICLAFRAPPESSAPIPAAKPPPEWDEETARLIRTGTTNAEPVLVQGELGGLRVFQPGGWPPSGGPPPGSRIIARKVDGGAERYGEGGTKEFVPASSERSMFSPSPRDADAGTP